ncbi:hypothetical protein ACN38_g2671, partial [Penicillium nordicum]
MVPSTLAVIRDQNVFFMSARFAARMNWEWNSPVTASRVRATKYAIRHITLSLVITSL